MNALLQVVVLTGKYGAQKAIRDFPKEFVDFGTKMRHIIQIIRHWAYPAARNNKPSVLSYAKQVKLGYAARQAHVAVRFLARVLVAGAQKGGGGGARFRAGGCGDILIGTRRNSCKRRHYGWLCQ